MPQLDQPHVAVVILNWNGRRHLETYLPSVLQTSYTNHQIWVIDNASTDDSGHWLQQNYGELVKQVQLPSNGGYAGGYNQGLKHIEADIYVLLNSDVEVTPAWLEPVVQRFNANPQVAAIQPHILDWRKRDHFEYAGAAGGYIDALGYPFCAGRLFEEIEKNDGQFYEPKSIFWASGACMFIRAAAYWQVGGLDERYFAHMEEIDLCWRLHHAGHLVQQESKSVVYHLGGGSLAYGNPRKTFLNFRNSLITLQKNLPAQEMPVKIFVRLVLDFPAALKFLAHGSFGDFWAVVRAHWSFFSMQRYIWEQRSRIPAKRSSKSIPSIYQGSAIYAHFTGQQQKLKAFIARRNL
jgi:GT2 family glycosyltransferase